MDNRKPTSEELATIKYLIRKSELQVESQLIDGLMVCELDDGKMGSLRLYPKKLETDTRMFGRAISELKYKDEDGVDVLMTLYLDENDELFELDVWKTNFASLVMFPDVSKEEL